MAFPYQLPAQTIYDLLSDSQKQLWLGTDKGLFRFNGKEAKAVPFQKTFQADITHLREDQKGRIWGMNFTKQLFYVEQDTLRLFPIQAEDFEGSIVNFDFTETLLWIGHTQGCVAYRLSDFGLAYQYKSKNNFTDFRSYQNQFFGISQYTLLSAQANGQVHEQASPLPEEARLLALPQGLLAAQVRQYARKAFLLSAQWQRQDKSFVLPENIFVFHYRSFSPQEVAVCSKDGLFLWDIDRGSSRCLLPNKQVTGIVADYQGGYWLSTLNEGLWYCPSLQVASFEIPADEAPNFELEQLQSLEKQMLIGSNQGFLYAFDKKAPYTWRKLEKAGTMEVKRIICHKDNIYAGTSIFSRTSLQKISDMPYFKDLTFYKENNSEYLLTAQSYGAQWYQTQQEKPLKEFWGFAFEAPENSKDFFSYPIRLQRAYAVAIDSISKRFWVAYNDGLWEYNAQGKVTHRFCKQDGTPLVAGQILYKNGKLIVATLQQGLFVFQNQKLLAHFDENALKSTAIRTMIPGNKPSEIWLGTDAEIGILHLDKLQYQDFLAQAGLAGIAYKSFYPDSEGLWLGLSKGLIFVPYNSQKNTNYLHLLPTKILTNDSQTLLFQIEALNYRHPAGTELLYRLRGIDQKWQSISGLSTIVRYDYLPYGRYTLEVKAQDRYGNASSEVQSLPFEVPRKWWQTWQAVLGGILLLVALFSSVFYLWFSRYRARQRLHQSLWISQLKALQAQMNPHFLYNILYTVQALVYDDRKKEAGDLLGQFSELMRRMLQASEKVYIDLAEEIRHLRLYLDLEKMRFEEDFSYQIHIENIPDTQALNIPSMLLQPLVENALKHGLLHKKGAKHLDIRFRGELQNSILHIEIEDNGIGREKSKTLHKSNSGFATKAIKKRIEILSKLNEYNIDFQIFDKKNTQGLPEGTLVKIHLKAS